MPVKEPRGAIPATGPWRKVLVLVNPKSGLGIPFRSLRAGVDKYWDLPGCSVSYQFSRSIADGAVKARQALADGVQVVLVAGGDGTVNSVGRELIGSDAILGVIPAGSGNGFARHFNIPLDPKRAVEALAGGAVRRIDVGTVDGVPFLVTCSMAWDASIANAFQRSPVRGVIPYIFAGFQGLLDYEPQIIRVELDGERQERFVHPLVLTVANLTQYGGGARIAPHAREDDGQLELVVALRQDALKLAVNLGRLFDGTVNRLPEVITRQFRRLVVEREYPAAIQIDGEVAEAGARVVVEVHPKVLNVLVPTAHVDG